MEITGPECGNGIKEEPEECDDGNFENDDGCSRACYREILVEREPNNTRVTAMPMGAFDFAQGHLSVGDVDWFVADVEPGLGLSATVSCLGDTVLEAFDAEGQLIKRDDDGGENRCSAMRLDADQLLDHVWLKVQNYSTALDGGDYILEVVASN